jgi:hypothetical protein
MKMILAWLIVFGLLVGASFPWLLRWLFKRCGTTAGGMSTRANQECIEPSERAQEALIELTERWGYRDITGIVKVEYERLERPLFDPATRARPRFLCVLQTPEGGPVYCFQPAQVIGELDNARAKGREYPQGCPAPDPADPKNLWLVVPTFFDCSKD